MSTLDSHTPKKIAGVFVDLSRKSKSPQIAIRFDRKTLDVLRRRSKASRKSVAFIVRQLVSSGLDEEIA